MPSLLFLPRRRRFIFKRKLSDEKNNPIERHPPLQVLHTTLNLTCSILLLTCKLTCATLLHNRHQFWYLKKSLNVLFSRKYLLPAPTVDCPLLKLMKNKIEVYKCRTLPKGMPTRLFTCRLLPFNQASLALDTQTIRWKIHVYKLGLDYWGGGGKASKMGCCGRGIKADLDIQSFTSYTPTLPP